MPHTMFRSYALASLTAVCLCFGCARKQPAAPPSAAVVDEGALAADCAMVARVDFAGLGRLGPMMRQAMAPELARGIALAGLDTNNLQRAVYCRRPKSAGGGFAAAIVGNIPGDIVQRAAARSQAGVADVNGVPVAASAGSWIARRTTRTGPSELIIASTRDELARMLFGPVAPYPLDTTVPFFVQISQSEVQKHLPSASASEGSPATAIRGMTVSVLPGGEVAVIRLVVGDAALSERLARSYEPIVSTMIARLAPRGGPPPDVSLKPENGDVVARIQLPAGMLDALAARVGSPRATLPSGTRPRSPTSSP
jgi:hypothetical protein